jgi:TolB-like protein
MTLFLMKLIKCFVLVILLMPTAVQAGTCYDWPKIFAKNRQVFTDSTKKRILVLPFVNEMENFDVQWLSHGLQLGMMQMLVHAKNASVIESLGSETSFETKNAAAIGKAAGAHFVIAGQYLVGEGTLKIFVRYVDVQKERSLALDENKIEWPHMKQFAASLVYFARRASKHFPKVKVNKKLVAAIRNEPRHDKALYHWSFGKLAQMSASSGDIDTAQHEYRTAIQHDFNYCYAYLGYSQSFAEKGFIAKINKKKYRELYQQAEREIKKAALLCPVIASTWGQRVMQYLEADVLQEAGHDYMAKSYWKDAEKKLKAALKILPGDLSAMRDLQKVFSSQGKGKKASEYTSMIEELTQCSKDI